jgi:glycosyltransferase involved in cell wall biosynthesis
MGAHRRYKGLGQVSFRRDLERLLQRVPSRLARFGHDALRLKDLQTWRNGQDGRPIALVGTNDLSRSGAPRLALEMTRALAGNGYRVAVVAMAGGPMREEFEAAGGHIFIDVRPRARRSYLQRLAESASVAVVNTIACAPLAHGWIPHAPVIWYLHEISLLKRTLDEARVRDSLLNAAEVWAGSELCAGIVRSLRADVRVFPYGVEAIRAEPLRDVTQVTIGVFGAVEPRKGQDLAIGGFKRLDFTERAQLRLRLFGRVLHRKFAESLLSEVALLDRVSYEGELDRQRYCTTMGEIDAVLVPSRDDTLPLVSLDALSAGRLLLLTRAVGTSDWLEDGRDALIEDNPSEEAIAQLFRRALAARPHATVFSRAARATFDRQFSPTAFLSAFNERIAMIERMVK